MRRPPVTLENYQQVYDFYTEYRPYQRTTKTLGRLMACLFKPQVTYAEGAEEQIAELFDNDRSIVIASNHVSATDPPVIAAMAMRESVLQPMIGNSFIPAKASLFKRPLRHAVDGLGSIPVFRKEDATPETEALLLRAGSRLFRTCIARLNAGQNMVIFPEATRNQNPDNLLKLQNGVGKMVCAVSDVEQPAVVPMAIRYDGTRPGMRKPVVYVSNPSEEPFTRSRDVMSWLQPAMQESLDSVIEISKSPHQALQPN